MIVEPIEEGNKVKAEIVQILNREHIRYLKLEGAWPKEFEEAEKDEAGAGKEKDDMFPSSSDEDDDDDDDNDHVDEDNHQK